MTTTNTTQFYTKQQQPKSTLVPYTTLFRSARHAAAASRFRKSCRTSSVRPRRPHARSQRQIDRKSTRLNSSHGYISYGVFCLEKKMQHGCFVGPSTALCLSVVGAC